MMTRRLLTLTALLALMAATVTAQTEQAGPPKTVELPLKQAVEMALKNNLDVVVARLNTQSKGEGIGTARGAYKPLFAAALNVLDSRTPASTQLIGAPTLQTKTAVYNFSWQQTFPFGLQYTVAFDNQRERTNSAFTAFNPLFDSDVTGTITQPLLKNFSLNPNEQRVVIAQNTERFARYQFETQVMDVVRDVYVAYLNLVQSIRGLEVAQKSLGLAQDLLRNNRIQVEVGTLAPIDVLAAEAEVASREEGVLLTQQAIQNAEDALKRLINDPESEDFWGMKITPVDQPVETEFQIDVEEAVRTALQRRPELAQGRADLDTRSYNVRYTRNQLRPQVDLVGSIAFSGLGGDQIVREGFAGNIIAQIPGGYGNALDQLIGGDYRNWAVGLNVSYPIGHSAEDAAHAQAQVDFRLQRAAIQSQELVIAQEVRAAALAVDTNRKRIKTTRVARDLAQKRLEAEQKKFEVGMSTSFLIVQAQRDLTEAAANELIALIDYNKALVTFERARGTLLERNDISVK